MVSTVAHNLTPNTETVTVIAKKGTNGTHLWEQSVSGTEFGIVVYWVDDLDGDGLSDFIFQDWVYDSVTYTETEEIIAKRGYDGMHLWEQTISGEACYMYVDWIAELNGDGLDDVIVYEWVYNETADAETTKLIAKRGINGTHLWEQSVNASGYWNCDKWVEWVVDLDGDDKNDVIVGEWVYNESTDIETKKLIAKEGNNGTHLWEESVSASGISFYWNCDIWVDWIADLDGDGRFEVIVYEGEYNESTNVTTVKAIAKEGNNGTHMWEQSLNASGKWTCDIWAEWLVDLDNDGWEDAIVIEWVYNESTDTETVTVIAKRGYDGTHLFEAQSDEPIWIASWWEGYDLDGDGQNDLVLWIPTEMYAVTYSGVYPNIFDTGEPANPYPSIMGRFNGTLTPSNGLVVHKLYTYPCSGTGGHSESVRIWGDGIDVNATWDGYIGDWHNITFDEPYVTLAAGNTYNITIKLGSYPQILHESSKEVIGGTINCTKFEDINGKEYDNWIPAFWIV